MLSTPPTFLTLRALHSLVGEAIEDIQRVFSQPHLIKTRSSPSSLSPGYPGNPELDSSLSNTPLPYAVPAGAGLPPITSSTGVPIVDYPSPDKPCALTSLPEQLAAQPDAAAAAMRIVAACGQISNIVHRPFLSLSDSLLSYHLSACLRLLEHLHVVEILREAEDERQRLLARGKTESPQVPPSSDEEASLHSSEQNNRRISSVCEGNESGAPSPLDKGSSMEQGNGKREETGQGTRLEGVHITDLARVIHAHTGSKLVDPSQLAHALRLLSAHHLLRETAPDTFALTRVASLLDTGKAVKEVFSSPETKYEGTNGIAAFAGLATDELFKSAAYLTEGFTGVQLNNLPDPSFHTNLTDYGPLKCSVEQGTREDCAPVDDQTKAVQALEEQENYPAFNLALRTQLHFFEWLESGGEDPLGGMGVGAGRTPSGLRSRDTMIRTSGATGCEPPKPFRFERFAKAMTGSIVMEAPGAILNGFDWQSLPNDSTIIDVGGGIGSTTMILARAFHGSASADNEGVQPPQATAMCRSNAPGTQSTDGLLTNCDESLNVRFIVQDRPATVSFGLATWRSQCPDMLDSGRVVFQEHDFFQPQPPFSPLHIDHYPAVYLLRTILHDWPDDLAHRILVNLRRASGPETKLLIVDHVLLLGCVDEYVQGDYCSNDSCQENKNQEWTLDRVLAHLEGIGRALAIPPLLPNMGKANATSYGLDLVMHTVLHGKERTLREFCQLALSAGWRVVRMTRSEGSVFGYLVCVPIALPGDVQDDDNANEGTAFTNHAAADPATVKVSH